MTKVTLHKDYVLVETQDIDFTSLKNMYNNRIAGFFGEYRWLSNFWYCDVYFNDILFPSVEHAYVYAKCYLSEEQVTQLLSSTPGEAKQLGKQADIKPDFEFAKIAIMKKLLLSKFSNPVLQQKLIDTKNSNLIEVNNWNDTFWGVTVEGNGLNTLGNLLEEVRQHYIIDSVAKISQ